MVNPCKFNKTGRLENVIEIVPENSIYKIRCLSGHELLWDQWHCPRGLSGPVWQQIEQYKRKVPLEQLYFIEDELSFSIFEVGDIMLHTGKSFLVSQVVQWVSSLYSL